MDTTLVSRFKHSGAAVNQLCSANCAELSVIALDLDRPNDDITQSPAMSEEEALMAIRRGFESVGAIASLLLLSEVGTGKPTVGAALDMAGFGGNTADWVRRRTGSDDACLARKIDAVASAVARQSSATWLRILSALSGRKHIAIYDSFLSARALRTLVILGGFICTVATTPLYKADPKLPDQCVEDHEFWQARLLAELEHGQILTLGMALDEGSGATHAINDLRSAPECHNCIAILAYARVSNV